MTNKVIQNFGALSNQVACSQAILCCVVFTSSSPQPKSNTIVTLENFLGLTGASSLPFCGTYYCLDHYRFS